MKKSKHGKLIIISFVAVTLLSVGPLLFAGFLLWNYSIDRESTEIMPGVVLEYPAKILANNSYDFGLTIRRQHPYTLTVLIPSELSIESVFPPTALTDSGINQQGETMLVLSGETDPFAVLPHISTQNTITQTINPLQSEAIAEIMTTTVINDVALPGFHQAPAVINDQISLSLSNSGLFDAPFSFEGFQKYKSVEIFIYDESLKQEKAITVDVENINRALWREYLSHYFRIFAAPVLGVLFGTLLVYEFDRRKNDETEKNQLRWKRLQILAEKTREFMDLLQKAIFAEGDELSLTEIKKKHKNIRDLHEKVQKDGAMSYEQIMYLDKITSDIDDVNQAYNLIENASLDDVTSAITSRNVKAWLGAMHLAIQKNEERLKNDIDFRRMVRLFPSDLLIEETDLNRYEKLRRKIKLEPSGDRKYWTRFTIQITKLTENALLGDLQLFPLVEKDWKQTARAEQEQEWLFSVPGFFYSKHPLRKKIIQSEGPTVVVGESGSGRTALAMDLTRYAPEGDVLCAYFTRTPSPGDIHRELVAQLLRFSTKRPTYLILLHHAEFNLLAELLNEVLGKTYVLSEIEKAEDEFRGALDEVTNRIEKIELHDSLTQLRILKTTVRRANVLGQFPEVARVIQAIARSLEFSSIRIGLDIDLKRYPSDQQLETLLGWGQYPITDMPVKVIFFVPELDDQWQRKIEKWSMKNLVLEWKKDHLKEMLLWRAEITGLPTDMFIPFYFPTRDTIEALINEAKGSPRRLAQLWRYIIQQYPDETEVTQDMIQEAGEAIDV